VGRAKLAIFQDISQSNTKNITLARVPMPKTYDGLRDALLSVEVDIWFSPRAISGQRAEAGRQRFLGASPNAVLRPSPSGKSRSRTTAEPKNQIKTNE